MPVSQAARQLYCSPGNIFERMDFAYKKKQDGLTYRVLKRADIDVSLQACPSLKNVCCYIFKP